MSKRPKRALIDMLLDILEIALEKEGVNKTHIVYNANLNFNRAGHYIQILKELGLIKTIESNSSLFTTTEKGKEFLIRYKNVLDLFKDDPKYESSGTPWKLWKKTKKLGSTVPNTK